MGGNVFTTVRLCQKEHRRISRLVLDYLRRNGVTKMGISPEVKDKEELVRGQSVGRAEATQWGDAREVPPPLCRIQGPG